MPAIVSRVQKERRRKAHGKSRKGCGNCKLRRVKCDESKPCCEKCLAYGVSCTYSGGAASLDLDATGSFQVDFAVSTSPSSSSSGSLSDPKDANVHVRQPKTILSVRRIRERVVDTSLQARSRVSVSDGVVVGSPSSNHALPSWILTEKEFNVLTRFQERTVLTIGTPDTTSTYRSCISDLALKHPFLMHMLLSLTLMHDAHLLEPISPQTAASHQTLSLQHWHTATTLFNAVLSHPLPDSYRDAVWATGSLLGAAVFAYVEPSSPEEAWPLKPADPTDLDWLKLSEGKKAIWKVANPTRPSSVFRDMAKQLNHLRLPAWAAAPDFAAVPNCWKRVFGISADTTIHNSPYCFPVIILSRLHGLTAAHDTIIEFLAFMAYMPSEFKMLLEGKDARAMMLLMWWFRKLEHGELWWIKKRAAVEGRAIEIWLERWFESGRNGGYRAGADWEGEQELRSQKGMALLRDTFKRAVEGPKVWKASFLDECEEDGPVRECAECPVQ